MDHHFGDRNGDTTDYRDYRDQRVLYTSILLRGGEVIVTPLPYQSNIPIIL